MKRTLVLLALLLSGCATEQPVLLPGQNTDELASVIAKEGRGESPPSVAPQAEPGGLLSANASSSPVLPSRPGVSGAIMGR
jgi:hypothetical protein